MKQTIIDSVIYTGNFETIRGLIAELSYHNNITINNPINQESFTEAVFWSKGEDEYIVAYSSEVMVINKNGKLYGIAPFNPSKLPSFSEQDFTLSVGSVVLVEGML